LTCGRAADTKNRVSKVSLADYRALAQFRYEIRKFLAFSESAARDAGIEPQQHQALLAIKGLPIGVDPTIGALAERLCVQHHTAVALVDKLEEHGWAERKRGTADRRHVRIALTPKASALLGKLSAMHRNQLGSVGSSMVQALEVIVSAHAHKTR
jgi:DNA-binding MarR family transcriptional regulator